MVGGRARQQALLVALGDRGRIGASPVRTDAIGSEQRLILEHLTKEPLGGIKIAVGGEQEVDGLVVLVDGPVQVTPPAADADVGLVDAHRAVVWLAELTQAPLDGRRVGEHPAVDRGVIHLHASLQEHLLDVAVAQRVAQVPGDSLDDQGGLKVPAPKVATGLALQRAGESVQDHGPAADGGGKLARYG